MGSAAPELGPAARRARLIITGASGFIGAHAVAAARRRGVPTIATGRSTNKLKAAGFERLGAVAAAADLHDEAEAAVQALTQSTDGRFQPEDLLLHLAWPGLPHFRDPEHLATHLGADIRFLTAAAEAGLRRVVVAGTCLEYGLQNGPLAETAPTMPTLAYPMAKDALRRWAEAAAPALGLDVAWARLFYMWGLGQHPKSLLAQLDSALARGEETFPMSEGEQLRDYLPVEEVAARLVALALNRDALGVFNIGSGAPISVRRLVEEHLVRRGADLALERGVFAYPDYEAMAFWADTSRWVAHFGPENARLSG